MSCPWKRGGQAQTAWERLTTRGSERRYIKGHPICTAAYTHPHIHKHRLTYLGLLSLKFITSGRTITLFDSVCVSQLQEEESSAHKQFGSAQKLGSFGTLPALSLALALFLVCEGESTARAWKRFIHRCNQKMCRAQQTGLTSHFPWLVVSTRCNKTARIISRWISGHLLPHPLISYCSLMRRKPPSTVIQYT